MGRRISRCLLAAASLTLTLTLPPAATAGEPAARYVGSQVCAPCHAGQHERFMRYSKKAHSSKNLRLMAKGLSDQELTSCYGCHTTGYGRPGGFTDFTATPQLADAGCEVCHGPGSVHAASGDPAAIKGRLTLADCEPCHNDPRVHSFGYKPLLNAGAH
ncbi:Cytochrome C553 (soluble cytochrome f) [Desulfovibrio sp. DV]|uniref:cytochrome c family protein n=1 Tax=Desulfovibrio sp. DV TaxID=1844708 RepID=UPI00095B0F01|nr:cytochrome c family protein [Desulfovibrio sp. DV]OLN25045.1 Cytochrome C553 (soluble cytochrome f) [Desulfovibrio sp. DV]